MSLILSPSESPVVSTLGSAPVNLLARDHYDLSPLQPPLHVRLPTEVRQLLKSINLDDLLQRYTNLEAVVYTYSQITQGMSEVDKMLFQSKVQLVDGVSYSYILVTSVHWPSKGQCTKVTILFHVAPTVCQLYYQVLCVCA